MIIGEIFLSLFVKLVSVKRMSFTVDRICNLNLRIRLVCTCILNLRIWVPIVVVGLDFLKTIFLVIWRVKFNTLILDCWTVCLDLVFFPFWRVLEFLLHPIDEFCRWGRTTYRGKGKGIEIGLKLLWIAALAIVMITMTFVLMRRMCSV